MRERVPHVLIFSVEQASKGAELNAKNVRYAERMMKLFNVQFIKGLGVYRGESESCFIVSYDDKAIVERLTGATNQESIFERDTDGSCWLHFIGEEGKTIGKPNFLGVWVEVNKEKAVNTKNYTEVNGRYFIAQPLTMKARPMAQKVEEVTGLEIA